MNQKRANKLRAIVGSLGGILLLAGVLAVATPLMGQRPSYAADIVVYKSPTCGCCSRWVTHLEQNGFTVESHDQAGMESIKAKLGVPANMQSCHTAVIGDYLIEGHVPADLISRLMKERPKIKGLAAPGMPMGSPGMEGSYKEPYDVMAFQADGRANVYDHR